MARILIDLDDTLTYYQKAKEAALAANPSMGYPQSQYGFYRNLKPIRGALGAFYALVGMPEHDVWIVTAPSPLNPLSYTEKRMWVEENLGLQYVDRLIICSDKSLIKGDILIDDCGGEDRGQSRFEGTLIKFDWRNPNMWPQIVQMIPRSDNFPYCNLHVGKALSYTTKILTDHSSFGKSFYRHSPIVMCKGPEVNYHLVTCNADEGNEEKYILEAPKSWPAHVIAARLKQEWSIIRAGGKAGWVMIPLCYNPLQKIDIEGFYIPENESNLIIATDQETGSLELMRIRPTLKKGSKRNQARELARRTVLRGVCD